MRSPMMRRLDKIERALNPTTSGYRVVSVPKEWADDSDEEIDERLARWRAGEEFEGMPPYIDDGALLYIIIRRLVCPGETCR